MGPIDATTSTAVGPQPTTASPDTTIQQTSPFFRLPRELRDEIYAYVFTDPSGGLRYEYGTARLLGSGSSSTTTASTASTNSSSPGSNSSSSNSDEDFFWALRRTCRQIRAETPAADLAFRHNAIVFDNLAGRRIPRPNYRKYLNRWDTEFSEQDPAGPARDAIAKPVADRVRSFLSRVGASSSSPPPQAKRGLTAFTVVELRPLEHVSALLSLFDEFGLPDATLTLVLVPSVVGTHAFETQFLRAGERLLTKRWFVGSRHRVRLVLGEGFEGLEEWVRMEFPTPAAGAAPGVLGAGVGAVVPVVPPVQAVLLGQVAGLRRLVRAVNGLRRGEGEETVLEHLQPDLLAMH